VVLSALIIELSGAIHEALMLPSWTPRLVTILLILGFPVVAILSWMFDISTQGIERTHRPGSAPGGGGLAEALQQARGAPVPEGEAPRRRGVPVESSEPSTPDPERVREAALGHVRHELRTPINGIVGYAEMLLEDLEGDEDEELVEDLERIRRAGRQLLGRVDGLLSGDHARDADDLEAFAETVRVDLRTPVSAVVGYAEMLMESCREAGRDALLDDLERILGSARRLLELSDDIVRVAVRSTGAGSLGASSAMTEQVLSRIGSGAAQGPREGAGRLLVVDDNETNRDLIARQLARFGYTVATAADGLEALDRIRSEPVDLVLLDVLMPRLDGVETLTRIRDDERLADTPVIMLSSLDEMDGAIRCLELGATDYITKPVQPPLLEARIAAALEVRDLRGRERLYRRRVQADTVLIDQLLAAAFPAFALDRVRDGSLQLRDHRPEAVAVRLVVPNEARPGSGPDGLDRLEGLQRFARLAEEAAAEHGVGGLLWRPDGVLGLLIPAKGQDAAGAAAGFALAVRDRVEGVAAGGHIGPLTGGVVGEAGPRFEAWGEAVEAAEALAAHAGPGTVLITPALRSALPEAFEAEPGGVKAIAGRGQMRVFALRRAGKKGRRVTAG
jgi:adenylate cyclase